MDRLLQLTAQAEAEHFWFQGFRSFLIPVIADLAHGRRNLTLIDCGCGTGNNLSLLSPYGSAFGFDVRSGWAGRRGGAGEAGGVHRRFVRADVVRIPFAANTFDIAPSFDLLQCIEADSAGVREMARVVRPGGAVVLTLAALDILRGDHPEAWGEVRRYTSSMARELVEQAGLRVERVSFLFASLFPLMLAVRVSQRLSRPFRELRDDTDIRVPSMPVNAMLTSLVRAEAALAQYVPMPIGSSILVVAKKT